MPEPERKSSRMPLLPMLTNSNKSSSKGLHSDTRFTKFPQQHHHTALHMTSSEASLRQRTINSHCCWILSTQFCKWLIHCSFSSAVDANTVKDLTGLIMCQPWCKQNSTKSIYKHLQRAHTLPFSVFMMKQRSSTVFHIWPLSCSNNFPNFTLGTRLTWGDSRKTAWLSNKQ